jgi:hypothetical protein
LTEICSDPALSRVDKVNQYTETCARIGREDKATALTKSIAKTSEFAQTTETGPGRDHCKTGADAALQQF